MKLTKKVISYLLTIVMLMSMFVSYAVFAEGEQITQILGTSTIFEKSSGANTAPSYAIMTGGNWIKTKITVPKAGIYSFTLDYTSTGDGFGVDISVGDSEVLKEAMLYRNPENTSGKIAVDFGYETKLGNVMLQEGENIITVKASLKNGGSLISVRNIILEQAKFEAIVQPVNKNVTTETNVGTDYITDQYYLLMKEKYVSIPVTVIEEGTYEFILKYVSPGLGLKVSVAVDGEVVLENVVLKKHEDNTGNYSDKYLIEECIGEIYLPFGTSTITISTPSSNGGSGVKITQFTIDESKAAEPTAEPTESPADVPTAEPTVEPTEAPTAEPTNVPVLSGNATLEIPLNSTNENISNCGTSAIINESYSQLSGDKAVSVPVIAETAGDYSITLRNLVAGPNLRFSVAVDGVTQISNAIIEHGGNTNYSSAYIRNQKLGNITLKEGINYIQLMTYKGNGGTPIMLYSITLQKPQEMQIVDFALNNASGGRMIYATSDGFETVAEVTLKKHGLVSGEYMLICGAYGKDGRLSGVNVTDIDCSLMTDGEIRTFKAPVTLDGNEKAVKAMLVDKTNYMPLESVKSVTTLPLFENNLLDSEVSYQLAAETLNNDGVNYAEYGLETDSYKIDAIFYDGHKDTKVFAYIGYPKTASETNKVPAMVLLHGGLGKAERYWVEKWNKLGFAAIAMDLYGRGPENDANTSSGKKEHPYAGVSPYAVPSSFLADVENAGMYQNMVAVINAHNILRSSGKVDVNNVGITGISWGGVTTTTVIGIDNRFKFAAPVYGCGFLDQSRTYFSSAYSDKTATILWDPANFAAKAEIPVLYVNGDTDANFSINSTSLTCGVTKNAKMSIIHNYPHDQGHGDSVEQVYAFAQSMVEGVDPFITVKNANVNDGVFKADVIIPEGNSLSSATMYYITTDVLAFGGGKDNIGWQTVSEFTFDEKTLSMDVPEEATHLYVSVVDETGYIISSEFIKVK